MDNTDRSWHPDFWPVIILPEFSDSSKIADITEKTQISQDLLLNSSCKNTELELKRTVKTLKMITECGNVLLHSETEQDLLDSICEIIVEHWGYFMTWIGYIGENWEKIVIPIARAWFDDGYLDSIVISWDENKENGRGPTGTAIREKRPVYIKNVLTDEAFAPWRDNAIKRWYRSSLALPLFVKNNIIWALCLYAKNIEEFNNEEISSLDKLSISISQCIEHIRDKEENKKTEELLRKSEKQLEIRQRMDSLGTLAWGIAHDFNNLLTGIMGYLSLINLDSSLSPENKEYIKNALIASKYAANLTKQIQNLSDNVLTEKTNIDLYKIASEVFCFLEKTTNKIIDKKIDLKEGEFHVIWSMTGIYQVFLNLGTNSSRAIEEKGPKEGDFIKISAQNYTSSENDKIGLPVWDYVHITFKDSGKGMSPDVLQKAFDPLFTTRDKSSQRGKGLWLAMVYNIITKSHNGHIEIESVQWKWTTVHIYLPKVPLPEAKKLKEVINTCSWHETILIIEDEKMIQEMVKGALEMCGYKVITASDWKEGLDTYIANSNTIDMVILDLTMPKMSGQEVLEKMLEIKNNVKVIISSGQSNGETKQGILSRAKGHVRKPYTLVTLYDTVREVLDMGEG